MSRSVLPCVPRSGASGTELLEDVHLEHLMAVSVDAHAGFARAKGFRTQLAHPLSVVLHRPRAAVDDGVPGALWLLGTLGICRELPSPNHDLEARVWRGRPENDTAVSVSDEAQRDTTADESSLGPSPKRGTDGPDAKSPICHRHPLSPLR